MARASDHNFLLALFRDQTFQAREIRRVLMFTTLYVALTTVLLGFFYHYMLGSMVAGVSPLMFVSEDMQTMDDDVPRMGAMLGKWLLLMLIVNLVVTLGAGIYIVRKLGAPIMALRRVIREIGEGNFAVKVRKDKDSEFSEVFNTLADSTANLRSQMNMAQEHLDSSSDDVEQLKSSIEKSREALAYFKTQQG